MSKKPTSPEEIPGTLAERMETLETSLLESEREHNRRRKLYFGIGLLLFALSVVSLTSLTRLSARLDAAAVTQLGRLAVEERLPDSMHNLEQYLKAQSGNIVRDVVRSALGGIPLLRTTLVQNLDRRLRLISGEMETRLAQLMSETLNTTRAAIDSEGGELGETEKLELLLEEVIDKFRSTSRIVFHEIYPQYVSELGRVEAFVADLHSKDPGELTTKERTQKEMIETLLRIMTREKYTPAGA